MVHTVLGPIPPSEVGIASMHDHLLGDCRSLHSPSREAEPADPRVTIENLGFVRWNLLALEDNLILDDPAHAVEEIAFATEAGQRTLVDLTSWGLGPRPEELPRIACEAGINVVAGVGAYLARSHPDWLAESSSAELAATFVAALTEELPGAGFTAGIIGLVGTGEPIAPAELRVLWAAGEAAARTGAAVVVRLDPSAQRALEVLDLLAEAGCPAAQVIFGNVDEFLDPPYLREIVAAGANLEWCFGNEAYYRDGYKDPTDAERLEALVELLGADEEVAARSVLGNSVWTKSQLRRYGGMGYDHMLRRIVPELMRRGVGEPLIERMLVENPIRLLDF